MTHERSRADHFRARGWVAFADDPAVAAWAAAVRPLALGLADDPQNRSDWLRCGGTWFAGVNILPNAADGSVPGDSVPPLGGAPVDFIAHALGLPELPLDSAQLSICYPGYPRRWDGETEPAFRYRVRRDAAHVDGLLKDAGGRRRIGEAHAFVMGLPLTDAGPQAAPFTLWEGSHELMRAAFRARLAGIPPDRWGAEDITDAYVSARREAFEICQRVTVSVPPGAAYICHRLLLHGVAPWTAGADGPERAIAYFRPAPPAGLAADWWLEHP